MSRGEVISCSHFAFHLCVCTRAQSSGAKQMNDVSLLLINSAFDAIFATALLIVI